MRSVLYLLLIGSVLVSLSCRERNSTKEANEKLSAEQLAEINRQLLIKDRERIVSYIKRKDLDMKETDTGLWISRDVKGSGDINDGDRVTLEYTCSLLDGTLVYNSEDDGLMVFEVGKSDIPSGINEGVKRLEEGSEAVLILPAYLGYGLLGDERKIPGRSILVYEITVVKVN
jgi:FKBP-type peptidyl-prolyl cis-trans isomerase